ncbi:hypothetical protein AB0D24_02990 [Streptomyces javensis]|uniref:hypothetical protein n=1 Tax=Streptomyces javensis TaxID=114698 RepID=UPI003406215A
MRYLSVAHNWAGHSVPTTNGGARLPRLFRWRAPSGKEVLVWMTDSPHGLAYMERPVLGFDTSYAMVDDLLPAYLTSLATNPYPFPPELLGSPAPAPGEREPYPWDVLHLRVQGHFGDNAPPRLILAETVRRWNETRDSPRLRLSTNTDFFADAEVRLGDAIPAFEGDWGDWWVEGVGSGARPRAMVRRAQSTVTDAATLYGIAALASPAGPPPTWPPPPAAAPTRCTGRCPCSTSTPGAPPTRGPTVTRAASRVSSSGTGSTGTRCTATTTPTPSSTTPRPRSAPYCPPRPTPM